MCPSPQVKFKLRFGSTLEAGLENHFSNKVIYSTDREHKNLYQWSLQEIDADGKKLGSDWIPWSWTLRFKAKDISLRENWSISERYPKDETKGKMETKERRVIAATLCPDAYHDWPPSYSMLGTDRRVDSIHLHIEEISDDDEERCIAYGNVSYTTEIDFRESIQEDALSFYFYVHANKFRYFAKRITSGQVDSLVFSVGHVSGFYSRWSPGISTDQIKILTEDSDHVVEELPDGFTIRRLGEVGKVELNFARAVELPPLATDNDSTDIDLGEQTGNDAALARTAREKRAEDTAKVVQSLRIVAWIIAALLLIELFK
jgi:hypothetical protein